MGHIKHVCLAANSTKRKDWTKVIPQHPQACNNCLQNPDNTHDVIWDSKASVCITSNEKDFIRLIKKTQNGKANGISGAMGITGSGKVRWSLINTAGELQHIELQCCCTPSATQRLSSTSVFCKAHPRNSIALNPESWTVQPDPNKLNKNTIDINFNPNNNLSTAQCICANSLNDLAVCFSENLTATHASNHNLDKPQKESLCWHCKSRHQNLQDIQELLQPGAPTTTHAMLRCPHK